MEPRFGLRCRGVVRCPYVHIRFLKSCLHYCDWTEDDLARKLRCNRFMIFAVPRGRCRRGIGRVRHLQRSLGLLRCDGRPASAQPVGAVRHEKQKTFFRASIFFHALSFLPRTTRALDKSGPPAKPVACSGPIRASYRPPSRALKRLTSAPLSQASH